MSSNVESVPVFDFAGSPDGDSESSMAIVASAWRYKFLLLIFTAIGLGVGYWLYQRKPTTYRSTKQLMFVSLQPLTFDSNSGAVIGGIPSSDLMTTLIKSDGIISRVAKDKTLAVVPSLSGLEPAKIGNMVRAGIQFLPVTKQRDDRMIFQLSFDGQDRQVCAAAVESVGKAIAEYFEEQRTASISRFSELITKAQDKVIPDLEALELEYQKFRESAPLEWDANNKVVNPHRERQRLMQKLLNELELETRKVNGELKLVSSIQSRNDSPIIVAQLISQLSGVITNLKPDPGPAKRRNQLPSTAALADLELKRLDVERTLVPLIIKEQQFIALYGDNHPSVKTITTQITATRKELNELDEKKKKRLDELEAGLLDTSDNSAETLALKTKAAEALIATYTKTLQEKLIVHEEDFNNLTEEMQKQKSLADQLTKLENNDAMYNRRIERSQNMLVRLEQQLAALDMTNINHGIQVEPLIDSRGAVMTGPFLQSDLMKGGLLALALGGLIAFIFEASAKMFRSADEISRELKVPVLAHVPLDEGRIKRSKNSEEDELSKLDPKLSVVHRPYSPAAEAIRGVRTAMLFDRRAYGSKVFQITSPLPGDGKSTVSANIACSLAQSGKRVLLIDLDLRSPRLSLRFNLDGEEGLTNVLNGEIGPFEAVSKSPVENLDLLGCGPLPSNPAEALTIAELGEVFEWARANYDFVIVDTPPLLMVTDPSIVTTYADAAILTMRVLRRCKPNAIEAVSLLRSAGARVIGVIVNKVDEMSQAYRTSASGSYQAIGYGYGDKYRRRYQKEVNASDTYVVKGKSTDEGFSKPLVGSSNQNPNPDSIPLVGDEKSPTETTQTEMSAE